MKNEKKLIEFLKQMKPGDQIRYLAEDGKTGYSLETAERSAETGKIVPGCWETVFIQDGEYGYFKKSL